METIRDYRKFAEECYRLARGIKDPEHKKILEEMAEAWLRLATRQRKKACDLGTRRLAISELAGILIALAAQGVLVGEGVHILGEARPNLRHLQHDGLGLRVLRGARDLETPRGKVPVPP